MDAVYEGSCHTKQAVDNAETGIRGGKSALNYALGRMKSADTKKMGVLDHPGLQGDASDPTRKAFQNLTNYNRRRSDGATASGKDVAISKKARTVKSIVKELRPFVLPAPENGRAYRCVEFCKVWDELAKPQRVHAMRKMQEHGPDGYKLIPVADKTARAKYLKWTKADKPDLFETDTAYDGWGCRSGRTPEQTTEEVDADTKDVYAVSGRVRTYETTGAQLKTAQKRKCEDQGFVSVGGKKRTINSTTNANYHTLAAMLPGGTIIKKAVDLTQSR